MWWESHNPVYGFTCNPYDLRCIVGGSSGGEVSLGKMTHSVFVCFCLFHMSQFVIRLLTFCSLS